MKILETRVLKGPNVWSVRRQKLIVLKLDIGEYEDIPTNKIPGFYEKLTQLIPTLHSHRCSEKFEGGFLKRVKEGTWLGHVIEHVALELQTLAGSFCGFGRTRSAEKAGIYYVVFAYDNEYAGKYAGKAAVELVSAVAAGKEYDVNEIIDTLKEINEEEKLGPSTESLILEAEKRNIPYIRLNSGSRVQFGYGVNQRKMQASISGTTSVLGVDIAGNKDETKSILREAGIPVPTGCVVKDEFDLDDAIEELSFPVVIKPLDGNHGRCVTTNIRSREHAIEAFHMARNVSKDVIVEKYITGSDFRFLVVNYKLVAVALRSPASVTGDGKSTIRELIEKENLDPRRGNGHSNVLTKIVVDEDTKSLLSENNLHLDSVIPAGQLINLKRTANLSTGGTSTDVTDLVHPDNVFIAERVARVIGLDICGFDVIATNVSESLYESGGAVIEVNAAPGLRMHLSPTFGVARNVAEPIMDMLFPEGAKTRIPIVAITGTNGKTTTTRLVAHLARVAGKTPGYTTTDGIYINDRLVDKGDCTGFHSSRFILKDPSVDFAVLECARGGILKNGLGFNSCDVAIVTNISEDHLGLSEINSLEAMARVKSVIPETVHEDGYSILNADDDLVYGMQDDLKSKIALFSLDPHNPRVMEHSIQGGISAVVEDGYFVIRKGANKKKVCAVKDVPLTMGGRAVYMIQNVLPAILSAYVSKFKLDDIRLGLQTFVPSVATTPGRLNIFDFPRFKVMVDYAHNAAGMEALGVFLDNTECDHRVGIITGIGDRRDIDIVNMGSIAAKIFDEIIIRLDSDLRGRTAEEIYGFVKKGIEEVDPYMPVTIIPDAVEATLHAIKTARDGAFITICTEKVEEQINVVSAKQKELTLQSAPTLKTVKKSKTIVGKSFRFQGPISGIQAIA